MSEPRFTKGEWRVSKNGNGVVSNECNGITIGGAFGEEAVGYYGGNLICESVSNDNANLIAAAPDMYRFIENLILDGELSQEKGEIAGRLLEKARGEV